ncbi:MAG: thioredoxin family protein [Actinobacteria bacterium]|nr:thioredoxin family protein [Actinomycetota bacterium]MBU1944882.1 thioredoxin family protein [Actinomycetota bacterium]MBU2688086.1 thioredoxin family protein [Actinomycetota bacterium]
MIIEVLGPGCAKCASTKKLISEVAEGMGAEVSIEPVTDLMEITRYDVMSTPGVVIDGEVVSSGKVPSRQEIRVWIEERIGSADEG